MRILHICNDYSYSQVYKNLYQELDLLGIEQIIYNPVRPSLNKDNNVFAFKVNNSQLIHSSFSLKKYHQVLFRLKIKSLFKDIENQIDISKIVVSYPTTLFSDGAIAYKLYKKYNIPYIVAVRNTDVNLFMEYRPDLLPLMHKILSNAKKIIFISKGLKNLFFSKIKKVSHHQYLSKIEIISNGVDDFWLDNIDLKNDYNKHKKLLFVGRFDTNKNVEKVIKSLIIIKREIPEIQLNLVGGGGGKENVIKKMVDDNSDWINYLGYVYDKQKLLEIYRQNNYFVMPSIHETFGLVYIEALSQGLPILYTKNQGVDGLFDEKVGVASFTDQSSVQESLKKMLVCEEFFIDKINFEQFRWKNIAKRYEDLLHRVSN